MAQQKPREILMPFTDDMVLAIMSGRKTQTRRELKLRQFQRSTTPGYDWQFRCSRGLWQDFRHVDFLASKYVPLKVGDRIGVRESAKIVAVRGGKPRAEGGDLVLLEYRADKSRVFDIAFPNRAAGVIVGRHCPNGVFREGVRTWLEVTGVRIERLNEISEADAIAEGIEKERYHDAWKCYKDKSCCFTSPVDSFASLWESIYGEGSFDNRWVIVTEFKVATQ